METNIVEHMKVRLKQMPHCNFHSDNAYCNI